MNHPTDLRRVILDQSRSLLLEQGFDRISMRKIAQAVGCSATSIYLYFKNKDALLHALIEEGFERMYHSLVELDLNGLDPLKRIKKLCRGFIDFGLKNPEYYEIMFQLHPKHMERYPVEKFRKARRNIDLIMNQIIEGHQHGIFFIPDARVVANVILATLHGGVSLLNAGRVDSRVGQESFIETIIASVLAGLKSTAQPGIIAEN
jgi:AcrR family transcriptional regulator